MDASREKMVAAVVSVASNTFLVITKLLIGYLIGSISVISEGIHSGIDLLASLIALFAVYTAYKPADEDHPFGHGKFENVSGVVEALLIFLAAGWIFYEAIHKFQHPGDLSTPTWGIAIMLFSTILNFGVSQYLFIVGKKTDSVALMADGWHLRTDVYTSLGVMVGLVLIFVGQSFFPQISWTWIDPVAAIFVSLLILKAAYTLTIEAGRDLLDANLPQEEIDQIKTIIQTHARVKGFHKLRGRKAGPQRFIEFHLVLSPELSLKVSHDITDELTTRIKEKLKPIHVTIHTEPCEHHCYPGCMESCLVGQEVEDLDSKPPVKD